jgi:hypothetical protein
MIRIGVFLRTTRQAYQTLRCLILFCILEYKIVLFRIQAYKTLCKAIFVTMEGLRVMKGDLKSNFPVSGTCDDITRAVKENNTNGKKCGRSIVRGIFRAILC